MLLSEMFGIQIPSKPPPVPSPKIVTLADTFGISPEGVPAVDLVADWDGRTGPGESSELDRILAIPRRAPGGPIDTHHPALEALKRPGCSMELREIQARALLEALEFRGLFALIGVGRGKTLISLLLPILLGHKRSVLLIPTSDRPKLLNQDYPALAKHWRVPNVPASGLHFADVGADLFVVTYTDLSNMKRGDILDRYDPTLIIGDEAHKLRNRTEAACARRFDRRLKAHPETETCLMSGSFVKRSAMDYGHLIGAALKDRSPLPRTATELGGWAEVIDVEGNGFEAPDGALRRLCAPGETARAAFKRRVIETGGVIATVESDLGVSLTLSLRHPKVPAPAQEVIELMRDKWERPDGELFQDILQRAAAIRQLACGFYYRWIFPRGEPLPLREEWKLARAEWAREVRDYLKHRTRDGMDSPGLLEAAARAGKWKTITYAMWDAIRDQVQPEMETVWLSDFLIEDAAAWGREAPGIIWNEYAAVGPRIAKAIGCPYFGGGPVANEAILREKGDRTIVASIDAYSAGKNFQAFNRNLIVTPPASGDIWEQLLGRTHRDGQRRDVTAELYGHVPENLGALVNAQADARFAEETSPNEQKLNHCRYTFKTDKSARDYVTWPGKR